MTIVGCRIDGRLIHGQVANLWTTKLNVSRIMVIDDEVAITRSINVVDADVEDFNKIHEKGVKITSQMVPNDTAEDFMKLLK